MVEITEITKAEKLTYEKIHQLMQEQDRLVAEGKMQRPQPVHGLSPEGKRALQEGIRLIDYAKSKGVSL